MFKLFWRIKDLPSSRVTAWRVLENKLTTKANLLRRGIAVGSVCCCFCGVSEEELNHMFFYCRVIWLFVVVYFVGCSSSCLLPFSTVQCE